VLTDQLNDVKAAQRRLLGKSPRSSVQKHRSKPSSLESTGSFALAPIDRAARSLVIVCRMQPFGEIWGPLETHSSTCKYCVAFHHLWAYELTCSVHQLALRAGQILQAPADFRNTLHQPDIPLQTRSGRYVRFWNTVWLIMVRGSSRPWPIQLTVRMTCCLVTVPMNSWLKLVRSFSRIYHRHSRSVIDTAQDIVADNQTYTVDYMVAALQWLDDWPVGLKLNTPLSHFFRTTFAAGVEQWGCE
jgi:hypothetical protein